MRRIAILVTHLLGSGHLSRALTLARAFMADGFDAQLISGGMPTRHLDHSAMRFVQLTPVRSDGANFTTLLAAEGVLASSGMMAQRRDTIVQSISEFRPDVLITELFPFGRRVLRTEFLAAIDASRALPNPALVIASVRDILAPPSSEKKAAQAELWLTRLFDGALVHGDPAVVPLEASWPVTPAMSPLLHYTGYVAPDDDPDGVATSEGHDEILVTAGGGAVGRRLFEVAAAASRLDRGHRWRLLVGGADAADFCRHLNQLAGDPQLAEPVRPDYRQLLSKAAAAVGQCGYNTAVDLLQSGTPGVFVPFAEAGEVEQTLRAEWLQRSYGYGCIAETALTAEALASAADAAIARGRFDAGAIRLDGAHESSRLVKKLLEGRP